VENKIREIYKDDFTEYLLCLALDVGEGMLKNGAEVGRVEDTIERICKAYGAVHVEVFTIISVINAAIRMPDGSYSSQLRRVKQTSTNLNTLEGLNTLSRKICAEKPTLEEFDSMLHELKNKRTYPKWVNVLASSVSTGAFCLFFGGGVIDAVLAFIIGTCIFLINNYQSSRLNSMAKTVISAFFAAMVAGLANMAISSVNCDSIIIGSIMILVPGIMFGTAMRDLLCGDLIAGTLKILQAIIQTLMIGFGYMLSYAILDHRIMSDVGGDKDLFLIQLVTSLVTSVSFAIVFKINRRHLVNAGICGLLTYAAYFGVERISASFFWAAFISSAAAALFSEVNARIGKMPTLVMLMPGIVPIVPGGYLYRTVRDLVCGEFASALSNLTIAGEVALGMAGGVVALSIIYGMISDAIYKRKNKNNTNKC
jgi:uncharacterized membrane protein YjjP (DUF1212 family)